MMETSTSDTPQVYPIKNYSHKAVVVDQKSYANKDLFILPKNQSQYIDKIVLSKGNILDRVDKMAQEITKDYYDKDVILLVIMKGAVKFGGALAEKITDILSNDVTNSYSMTFSVEYVDVKSYVDDKSTGDVKIKIDEKLKDKIKGRNVLIVEDIYDSGQSLYTLNNFIMTLSPLALKTAVLIQKMNMNNLKYNYMIDYIGFLVPDDFLIGFGLDYNNEFRQLNHLCTINTEGITKFKSGK